MACCCLLTHIALVIGFLLALAKLYVKLTTGWCKSQVCLVGKTAIVTGANSGIGYETALDFAKRGAKVILACRSQHRAEEARRRIVEETRNEKIVVKILDLASFESVRQFAKEIKESEDRLDILVNNAGVYGVGDRKTVDGLPLLMQANHFSEFLLTSLLMDLLKKTGDSRIVNVSSYLAKQCKDFDLDRLDQHIPGNRDYHSSKLCNVLFTIELAKRLEDTGVTTYSVHPGLVYTDVFKNLNGFTKTFLVDVLVKHLAKTSEEGAQTQIHCSIAKGIEHFSGEHFDNCRKVERYETATVNPELPRKLWERSEEIVGQKFNI